jgi:heme exporter protein C
MNRYLVPVLIAIAIIGLVVSQSMIFFDTPLQVAYMPDGSMSGSSLFFNYKIFFYHVPHASMLFVATITSGICSIMFLWKRNPKWDDVALASAEVAVAFGAVTLLTGSIWAKAAWDHWWVWENRLTMSLLLFLTLVGYVLVRRFAGATGDRLAAGMAVFGMISVPFIYVMVGRDDSHPQAGSGGNVDTLDPAMRPAFWLSMATMLIWFLILVIVRIKGARAERELRELREQGFDAGVLS